VKKHDRKNEPRVENYEVLAAWLDALHARNVSVMSGPGGTAVEQWIVGKGLCIIILQPNQRGWDILTSCTSIGVEETIVDAEKRLDVKPDGARLKHLLEMRK
jgi:hypothetical protein